MTQLCPGSIATATPQTLTVASSPAQSTGSGVGLATAADPVAGAVPAAAVPLEEPATVVRRVQVARGELRARDAQLALDADQQVTLPAVRTTPAAGGDDG
ncbi:hypothetical protein [Frankia sp. CcWB3]